MPRVSLGKWRKLKEGMTDEARRVQGGMAPDEG